MPVKPENLEKVLAEIKKQYGNHIVKRGDEYVDPPRVPTGIIQLDAILGGGMPMGRVNQLYGGYSSGKSMICWHVIREAQKMGLQCVYYDVENQYEKSWVESLGVDTTKLQRIETSTIDEVGDTMEGLLGVAHVHVIDSVAMGISNDEKAAKIDEWQMAISTRVWDKVLRRANSRFDKEENMILFVNQARQVFGKSAEKPWGGRQLDHICSVILNFKKSSWLYKDKYGELTDDSKKAARATSDLTGMTSPDGMEIIVRVDKARKTKVQELATARMRLAFGDTGKLDEAWALARAAIFYEVVDKRGSWYTLPDGSTVQGEAKLKDYIRENEEFANKLRQIYLGDNSGDIDE